MFGLLLVEDELGSVLLVLLLSFVLEELLLELGVVELGVVDELGVELVLVEPLADPLALTLPELVEELGVE